MLGRAPFRRATWSQKIADSEPVTARFGPRSSPSSSARGCAGSRADSTDRRRQVVDAIAVPAASHAVAQRPVCVERGADRRCARERAETTATRAAATSSNGLAALDRSAHAESADSGRRQPDREHGQRGPRKHEHEHRGSRDRDACRRRGRNGGTLPIAGSRPAQVAPEDKCDEHDRHRDGDAPGRRTGAPRTSSPTRARARGRSGS